MIAGDSDSSNLSDDDLQRKILVLEQENELAEQKLKKLEQEVDLLSPYFVVDKKERIKRRILIALSKKEWMAKFSFLKDVFQYSTIKEIINLSIYLKQITHDDIVNFIDGIALIFINGDSKTIDEKTKPYTDKLIDYFTNEHFSSKRIDRFVEINETSYITVESLKSMTPVNIYKKLKEYVTKNSVFIKDEQVVIGIKKEILGLYYDRYNKKIADFRNDKQRVEWVNELIESTKNDVKNINYPELSRYSGNSQIYYTGEIQKIFERARELEHRWACWVDNPKKISDLSGYVNNVILGISGRIIKDDAEKFVRCYLEWEKLVQLLKKVEKDMEIETPSPTDIIDMFSPKLKEPVTANLRKLWQLDLKNKNKWDKNEFSAVCYFAYIAFSDVFREPYVNHDRIKFEPFKKKLANYFERDTPTNNLSKSEIAFNKLDEKKKRDITRLFSS